jgi:hypothetical protein
MVYKKKNNRHRLEVAIALFLGVTLFTAALPAEAALVNQQTNLRVLVLAATGNEPTTAAWVATLQAEGVPYDLWVMGGHTTPITAASFTTKAANGFPVALYQGVIVASDSLYYTDATGAWTSALSPAEWTVLQSFEATYGIRQVSGYVYPSPNYGLNYPRLAGDLGGITASLTAAGSTIFPYLQGPVAVDVGSWGYLATPSDPTRYVSLVNDPSGDSLVGIYTHPDTRQEMVVAVDQNAYSTHNLLLRHGMLNWVTQGVYLGYQRFYLTLHIDDFFLPDDAWDPSTNQTITATGDGAGVGDLANGIRLLSTDVTKAVAWAKANNFVMDWLYNGQGYIEFGPTDPTNVALLANRANPYIRWMSHTFSHYNFDNMNDPVLPAVPATLSTISSEIAKNIQFGIRYGLPINRRELCTGGHTGLLLSYMPTAVTSQGLTWVRDDASLRPEQWKLGSALTVPAWPTNVYYNVSTQEQQLSEYNYLYLPPALGGSCVNTAITTCFSQAADWSTYMKNTVAQIYGHVLANDPKPHFMHQSNLAGDGLVFTVMDAVFAQYKTHIKVPFLNLPMSAIGQLMTQTLAWNRVNAPGTVAGTVGTQKVSAYLLNGKVVVRSTHSTSLLVPVTGTTVGTAYGGTKPSGWLNVPAGGTVTLNVAP